MPLLVVVAVAGLVFFYVRVTRRARERWLAQLDLLGNWHWRDGDARLSFSGARDQGRFELLDAGQTWRGEWRLQGHELRLMAPDRVESMDLNLFKAGQIGLEDERGVRRVFNKSSDNVVRLHG